MNNLTIAVAFKGDSQVKDAIISEIAEAVKSGDIVRAEDVEQPDTPFDTPLPRPSITLSAETGIPVWFLMLSETLAAHMSLTHANRFILEIIEAVPTGSDLNGVWPIFVRELLRSGNGGLGVYVSGPEESAQVIHVSTLHKFTQPDAEALISKAERGEELSLEAVHPCQKLAMTATCHVALASYYGTVSGSEAQRSAVRSALRACHSAAGAMTQTDVASLKLVHCDAYAAVGQILLDSLRIFAEEEAACA